MRAYSRVLLLGFTLALGSSCKTSMTSGLRDTTNPDDSGAAIYKQRDSLPMTLKISFADLFNKEEEKKPIGTLTYTDSEGKVHSGAVEGKIRGQRSKGKCSFPKFKLKIKKDQIAKLPDFQKSETIKFGTHCEDKYGWDMFGGVHGEEKIAREAYIYRMGEILGLEIAKARMGKIEYIDTSKDNQTLQKQVFFFEDSEVVAKRLGYTEFKPLKPTDKNPSEESYDTAYIAKIDNAALDRAKFFKVFVQDWDGSVNTSNFSDIDESGKTVETPQFLIHNYEPYLNKTGNVIVVPSDMDMSIFVTNIKTTPRPVGGMLKEKYTPEMLRQLTPIEDSKRQLGKERLDAVLKNYIGKKDELLSALKQYPMDANAAMLFEVYINHFYTQLDAYLKS